ncbi:hypothetical protein NL676_039274 [Syzygium grande]|nr:hypothetical protein NL676_039274 [Syzygium grande]
MSLDGHWATPVRVVGPSPDLTQIRVRRLWQPSLDTLPLLGVGKGSLVGQSPCLTEVIKFAWYRKNDGGIESAKFLSKLIECVLELLAVDAAYNIMPPESLPVICLALQAVTGNLVLLNLRGHNFDKLANDASVLVDLERDGRLPM